MGNTLAPKTALISHMVLEYSWPSVAYGSCASSLLMCDLPDTDWSRHTTVRLSSCQSLGTPVVAHPDTGQRCRNPYPDSTLLSVKHLTAALEFQTRMTIETENTNRDLISRGLGNFSKPSVAEATAQLNGLYSILHLISLES